MGKTLLLLVPTYAVHACYEENYAGGGLSLIFSRFE